LLLNRLLQYPHAVSLTAFGKPDYSPLWGSDRIPCGARIWFAMENIAECIPPKEENKMTNHASSSA
jgi:hypothetical protein